MEVYKIKVLGNYCESKHEATRIVSGGGISPTIKHNHGSVVAVLVKTNGIRENKTSN